MNNHVPLCLLKPLCLSKGSQCLELTSDQLDMLILGRLDGHTKERVGMKRYRSYYFVRGLPENIFVSSLHIQKEAFEPEISLER